MAFSESWLGELIAKNDIVSVVSSYMELRPKGRRLWGLCPLHGEKTASFSVSPDKQLFYCFGCHAGGSVIQFIMDMERLSYPEAVRFLAERAGMQMPEEVDDRRLQKERAYRERLYEANKRAARFYMETLLGEGGGPGRAYLRRRGLGTEAVKRFGIGYAPEGWDTLKNRLFQEGFSQPELLEAGLLVRNESKGTVYDAFRGRVIFPILGTNGRVLGFGARVLDDGKPKYINTGDTPVYNKRMNLYGLNLQKGGKLADLVMVEGYMDVIGLWEAGVTNAVASLGTALTVQQARLLKRYAETVFIAYDGDAAGQNAMIRGLEILAGEGLQVRVIVFPDGLDPDEFVRERGREAFEALKDNALTLNAFKLESMARDYDLNAENDREQYAMAACRFIAGLQPLERDRYYLLLAKKTGYPVESLRAQGGAGAQRAEAPLHRSRPAWKNNQNTARVEETERFRAETALLAAMLQSREAAEHAVSAGPPEQWSAEAYRTFFNAVVAAYARDGEPNAAAIIGGMEQADAAVAGAVLREDMALLEPVQTAADCLKRICKYDLQQRVDEITQLLADPALDAETKNALVGERVRLGREIRS